MLPLRGKRMGCLVDSWFEDKIQSGEEWSAGLRTGYFFFCEMPFGANTQDVFCGWLIGKVYTEKCVW